MRYIFYTDGEINSPILDFDDELSAHEIFTDNLFVDSIISIKDINYLIKDISKGVNTSPEFYESFNICLEKIE